MRRTPIRTAPVLAALAGAVVVLTACTSGSEAADPSASASPPASSTTSAGGTSTLTPGDTGPVATGSGGVATPSVGTSAAPSVSVPTALCTSATAPADVADAYVGALGAGELEQALACVQPGTVPEATTRSLLVTTGTQSAAYLRDDTRSTATTFVYTGARTVTVTVSTTDDPPRVTAVTAS